LPASAGFLARWFFPSGTREIAHFQAFQKISVLSSISFHLPPCHTAGGEFF
jgi:hypothetical protein